MKEEQNKTVKYQTKLYDAFIFVDEMQEEVNHEMALIENELLFCKQRINELVNTTNEISNECKLSTLNELKSEKQKYLFDTLEQLRDKINSLDEDSKILQIKMSKINNLRDCIALCNNEYQNKKPISNSKVLSKGNLGKKILHTQEVERKRIARDLHDSTVQNLTCLVHKIELCIKLLEKDSVKAKLQLAVISEIIKSTINGMREIIYDLRPMTLNDIGLEATVKQYFEKLKHDQNMQVVFKIIDMDKKATDVSDVVNLTLYRIIQEACNNVIKHSNASTLLIEIKYTKQSIVLKIKDDGIGFDISNQECVDSENCGFGLSIMKERVYLLCGNISIKSQNNKGTQIDITVPYDDSKGESI